MSRSILKSAAFSPVRMNAVQIHDADSARQAAGRFAAELSSAIGPGSAEELDILIERIEDISMRAVKTIAERSTRGA